MEVMEKNEHTTNIQTNNQTNTIRQREKQRKLQIDTQAKHKYDFIAGIQGELETPKLI